MKLYYSILSLLLCTTIAIGQNTVGLLSYSPDRAYDGYNLLYAHNQSNVYLLNNCGEIVHTWEDEAPWVPGNTAYLTEGGLLYKTKRASNVGQDAIFAGGGGATIEIRDWDNNLIWTYTLNTETARLHHDIAVTPEGTVLAIAWELKTNLDCTAAGRDISTLAQDKMWPDYILEIDPTTDEIIWEWHAWDHLIQDFDSTRNNYGVIANHPELIDVNYGRPDGHPDWMHANSIDFNPELNQILLSVPYFDEVWIIDHTTTTEEAAGSFGGFGNRGGDLLYRWGNPITYGQGTADDRQLFFQHDAHWVDEFLDPSHPQYGKIAVFNNHFTDTTSVASVIAPDWDMYEWEYKLDGNTYLPATYDFNLSHPEGPTQLWSTAMSSVQILPNGNSLILAGRFGYVYEVTPDNELVWEYKVPRLGPNPATQGDTIEINQNITFRFDRYPKDFAAFAGRDLEPQGYIELEPDVTFCDRILPTVELLDDTKFVVYPNPVNDMLTVEWEGMMSANIQLINLMGQAIYSAHEVSGGRMYIDVSGVDTGVYFLSIDGRYTKKVIVQN